MIVTRSEKFLDSAGMTGVARFGAYGVGHLFRRDGVFVVTASKRPRKGYHRVRVLGCGGGSASYVSKSGRAGAGICSQVFRKLGLTPPRSGRYRTYYVRVVPRRAARKPRGGRT